MLLTENNVNYEALSQTIAEMSGEEVTLKRVLPSELESLHQAMLAPAFHSTAGFESPPSKETLQQLLFEENMLILWHTFPAGSTQSIGYSGWSYCSGPAFLFFMPTHTPELDLILVSEAMEMITHAFFSFTPLNELFIYVDRPVDDDIHATLVESGFDPWDELPTINNEVEAAYIMKRSTFHAYFGEGEDDFDH
tara:strand:- start:85 stop:666 length:582 start_codon:yes stop_codon:yes gene_type:complete